MSLSLRDCVTLMEGRVLKAILDNHAKLKQQISDMGKDIKPTPAPNIPSGAATVAAVGTGVGAGAIGGHYLGKRMMNRRKRKE